MSSANGPTPPKPSQGTTPQGKKKGRLALYLGILAGLLVSLVFLLPLCRTTGQEFSPTRFQTRQFYLYRIPGTDLQFLPTFQSSMPNDTPAAILKDLRTYGSNDSSNDTWHMLKADSRGGDSFPANLLVTSLMRCNVENQPYWGAWSSKHQGYAATLWPIIQAMAMSNLYHEIPEVLRFAEAYSGPENDFAHELLKTIHEKIQQRKDRYGLAGSDIPTGKQAESEGIVDWEQAAKWLKDHPIPAKSP